MGNLSDKVEIPRGRNFDAIWLTNRPTLTYWSYLEGALNSKRTPPTIGPVLNDQRPVAAATCPPRIVTILDDAGPREVWSARCSSDELLSFRSDEQFRNRRRPGILGPESPTAQISGPCASDIYRAQRSRGRVRGRIAHQSKERR